MTHAIGVVAGSGMAMYLKWVSQRIAKQLGLEVASHDVLTVATLTLGGATGGLVVEVRSSEAWVLAIVASLAVVQTPIDIGSRRLLRSPTWIAASCISLIYVIDMSRSEHRAGLLFALLVTPLISLLWLLLRYASRDSLGFGDVLLVVPLTLATAHVAVGSVLIWQLVASLTGSIHAIVVRVRSGSKNIPFGPHLLGTAWIVLVASV